MFTPDQEGQSDSITIEGFFASNNDCLPTGAFRQCAYSLGKREVSTNSNLSCFDPPVADHVSNNGTVIGAKTDLSKVF